MREVREDTVLEPLENYVAELHEMSLKALQEAGEIGVLLALIWRGKSKDESIFATYADVDKDILASFVRGMVVEGLPDCVVWSSEVRVVSAEGREREAVFTTGEDFWGHEYCMLTTFFRDETGKPIFLETQQGQSEGVEERFASWYSEVNLDPEVINWRNENPEDRERRIRTLLDVAEDLGLIE